MTDRDAAIAIFYHPRSNRETWFMPALDDPKQIAWVYGTDRHAADANSITLDQADEEYSVCVKSPFGSLYHVWHVCLCDKCTHEVRDLFGDHRQGGRVFDHSQGAWDEHLRFVDNDKVLTFKTPA
jgi:hypothetical protein